VSERVLVIETGRANLASAVAAFRRLGADVATTSDADAVRRASRVVLPGVGAFGDVAARLDASGLAGALRERFAAGRPTLAICLGLQVLAAGSEESPGVAGLGVIPGTVGRFGNGAKVPQLGWNAVRAEGAGLVRDGHAFYANSYRLEDAPTGWDVAWSDHDGRFVAAIERGPQLACQFHPELSGAWGSALLGRWMAAC
jgi:imidazole glycerol phosphate synthase glutamine amidotransferase subunit